MESSGRRSKLPWLIPAIFILFMVVYWIVFAISPEFHQRWFRGEDHLVEWLTFTGFFLASLVTASVLRFHREMDIWSRLYIAGLALFFFLCAGEEISWGQRVVGFKTPPKLEQVNVQDEFNLHNIKFHHFHPLAFVSALLKGFGIIAPLGLLAWRRIDPRVWRRYISPVTVVPCFAIAELVVTARKVAQPWVTAHYGDGVALIVKLDTVEMKEMFWGLSCLLASLSIYGAWVRRRVECRVSSVEGTKLKPC